MGNSHLHHYIQDKKYDAIFFSPHLDDAILSAGNIITSFAEKKQTVLIATIFTTAQNFPGEDAKKFALHCGFTKPKKFFQARKTEDITAAKLLAADTLHFDFIDAGFRSDHPNFNTVFTTKLTNNDLKLIDIVAKKIKNTITKYSKPTSSLFFPLGVGWHVDHQIIALSSQKIWQPSFQNQLVFWEDVPYRNMMGATIAYQAKHPELTLGSPPTHLYSGHIIAAQKKQAVYAYRSQITSLLATGGYMPSYDNHIECFWYV